MVRYELDYEKINLYSKSEVKRLFQILLNKVKSEYVIPSGLSTDELRQEYINFIKNDDNKITDHQFNLIIVRHKLLDATINEQNISNDAVVDTFVDIAKTTLSNTKENTNGYKIIMGDKSIDLIDICIGACDKIGAGLKKENIFNKSVINNDDKLDENDQNSNNDIDKNKTISIIDIFKSYQSAKIKERKVENDNDNNNNDNDNGNDNNNNNDNKKDMDNIEDFTTELKKVFNDTKEKKDELLGDLNKSVNSLFTNLLESSNNPEMKNKALDAAKNSLTSLGTFMGYMGQSYMSAINTLNENLNKINMDIDSIVNASDINNTNNINNDDTIIIDNNVIENSDIIETNNDANHNTN